VVNGQHSWVPILVLFGVMAFRLLSSQRRRSGGRTGTSPGARGFTSPVRESNPAPHRDPDPGTTAVDPVEATFTGTAPGWFTDPFVRHEQRYWSGRQWTDHVTDAGVPGVDPAPGRGGANGAG